MPQRGRTRRSAETKTSAKATAKPGSKAGTPKKKNQKSTEASHSKDRVARSMSDEQARALLETSTKLYYRIGEVSELTGVKAHVLRYWETEFRWMAPPKSRSKQRLYRKRDIEFVWLLKRLLWDERYTIAGARQRIQELGVDEALQLLTQPPGKSNATPVVLEASETSIDLTSFKAALGDLRTDLMGLREELVATP